VQRQRLTLGNLYPDMQIMFEQPAPCDWRKLAAFANDKGREGGCFLRRFSIQET